MVTESLARSGMAVVTEHVDSPEAFTQALREFAPDVVLSDDVLENYDARAALEAVQTLRPTAPLIVVSGAPDAVGVPMLVDRPLVDGAAAAYVCRGMVCDRPVTTVADLTRALSG